MAEKKSDVIVVRVVDSESQKDGNRQPPLPSSQQKSDIGDAEQAFLAKLQQRAENAKPENLFSKFLQEQGFQVMRPKMKGISFIAGNGKTNFAVLFSGSNKDILEFKVEHLEPLFRFYAAFRFVPILAILWRKPKMAVYRIMNLSDGELRIYGLKNLAKDFKQKTFSALRAQGMPAHRFKWQQSGRQGKKAAQSDSQPQQLSG